jgi:PEP-CTERM motif
MNKSVLVAVVALLTIGLGSPLSAVVVTANMNIFGAGHPAAPFNGAGTEGVTPVLGIGGLTSGNTLTITSTGTTSCGASAPCTTLIGADGAALVFPVGAQTGTDINALAGANVGISGITFTGRMMFLTGVFIGATEPTGTGPAQIFGSYTPTLADTTTSFTPLLYQSFYIGDGLAGFNNGAGAAQQFIVPTGGTRLFLGFMDAFNNFVGFPSAYTDNTGSLTTTVTVLGAVPEPGTVMLMGLGLLGIALLRKKLA